MPKAGIDRDDFVARIEKRRKWARYVLRARRLIAPDGKSFQAALYESTFHSDDEVVSYHYAKRNDHLPDLDDPVWLNEKIRWQFLHHPNPLMSYAADKIAVREYLRRKGSAIEPPRLIAQGEDAAELATVDLPETFVLKSSFGSGQNHIEKAGMRTPRAELIAKVLSWAEYDQWRQTGEFHYRNVRKRWLVEEYLDARQKMYEYKVFCIMGEPIFIAVITERNVDGMPGLAGVRHALFDLDWNRVDFGMRGVKDDLRPVPPPPDLELVVSEARRLAEDFMHVRVDILCCDGRLAFSELTFASMAARVPFEPLAMNVRLGALMDLDRAPEYLSVGRRAVAALEHPAMAGGFNGPPTFERAKAG